MIRRRDFVLGAGAAVAAPHLLKTTRAQGPRVRRNVQSLSSSDPFFAKYGEAVQKMHQLPAADQRHWRNQALKHLNFCVHSRLDFAHWHRHYITNFELICGELINDSTFALPYWDWTANRGRLPDPFYDLNFLNVTHWNDLANGASSPNWNGGIPVNTRGSRRLPKGQGLQDDPNNGQAFAPTTIDGIQRQSNFTTWAGQMEGSPHGLGHVITGGSAGHMGNGMSPFDPIFWLHHCNIDRLWAEWQDAGNTTPPLSRNYSGHFVDGKGQPVTDATSANALDIARFNFIYDTLEATESAVAGQRLALQPFQNQKVLQLQAINVPPQTLAAQLPTAPTKVTAGVKADFVVTVKDLLPNLFRSRTYWAAKAPKIQRLAAESGRVLARLTNVSAPETGEGLTVKVFVNCPYLSPATPSTDPLYAGGFSFFGLHGPSHGHGEFTLDITRPLRTLAGEGAISTEQVSVQLMAVPVDEASAAGASFTVGGVEILAV